MTTFIIWWPDGSSVLTQDRGYAERANRLEMRRVEYANDGRRFRPMPTDKAEHIDTRGAER